VILLDTNVLSELMRGDPEARVVAWMAAHSPSQLFATTISQAEILYGIGLLAEGRRRQALTRSAEEMFAIDFAARMLPFDSAAARAFAQIAVSRRRAGRVIGTADAMIAAIAHSRGAAVATRNVEDFRGCGVEIIDPWSG
jgi:predicted nucleic acid-binding protein